MSGANRWRPQAPGSLWPAPRPVSEAGFRAALAAAGRAGPYAAAPSRKARQRPGKRARAPAPAIDLSAMFAAMSGLAELVGQPAMLKDGAKLGRGASLIEIATLASGARCAYLHIGGAPNAENEAIARQAGAALAAMLAALGVRTRGFSVNVCPILRGVIPRGHTVALHLARG